MTGKADIIEALGVEWEDGGDWAGAEVLGSDGLLYNCVVYSGATMWRATVSASSAQEDDDLDLITSHSFSYEEAKVIALAFVRGDHLVRQAIQVLSRD